MNIDLKVLRQRGENKKNIAFSFVPDPNLLALPDSSFLGEATVEALIELYDDEAFLSGKLTYRLKAECSRCLVPVTVERVVEFDERFIDENGVDDGESYFYERDRINTDRMVNELILTDMPLAVYCKDDCKGICPKCGKNLNQGDCGCEIQ